MSYREENNQVILTMSNKTPICLCMCDGCMPRREWWQDPDTKVRKTITNPKPYRGHCCGPECSKREEDKL
jgi:hypothetical protein